MRINLRKPKRDCFAFKDGHCVALDVDTCEYCHFYKTVEQDIQDIIKHDKALNRHLGIDVRDYSYEDIQDIVKTSAHRCCICGVVIPRDRRKCPVCEETIDCISGRRK